MVAFQSAPNTKTIRFSRGPAVRPNTESNIAEKLRDAFNTWPYVTGICEMDFQRQPVAPKRLRINITN